MDGVDNSSGEGVPRGQTREMSQTTATRLPTATGRVTSPDPSDTLGDPVVEQTVKRLIETAGRLVANKNAQGSGVTAPMEQSTMRVEYGSLKA